MDEKSLFVFLLLYLLSLKAATCIVVAFRAVIFIIVLRREWCMGYHSVV